MKKKIIALILAGTLIWIGAMWYDTPVKKELRTSNISWERW